MNYITTNIRFSETDYLRLKAEAAVRRKSLSALVREKVAVFRSSQRSKVEVARMLRNLDRIAHRNAKILKGWNSLEVLRQMRKDS